MLRVTVAEWNALGLEDAWETLQEHVAEAHPRLVVLPEMPFSPWLAARRTPDAGAWEQSVADHDTWTGRLRELGTEVVVGTRPVITAGRRFNQGFVWTPAGCRPAHLKAYLPDEPGFWEASWYERGPTVFEPVACSVATLGFQICTELWFPEHARAYGLAGVELIVCPRATPVETLSKWVAGGQTAAVIAGAYCLSSNHSGRYPGVEMAGGGWVTSPDGEVLARTAADEPFVTVAIDPAAARAAKGTYPRDVDSSEVGL